MTNAAIEEEQLGTEDERAGDSVPEVDPTDRARELVEELTRAYRTVKDRLSKLSHESSEVLLHVEQKIRQIFEERDAKLAELLAMEAGERADLEAFIDQVLAAGEGQALEEQASEALELFEQHVSIERIGRQVELGKMMEEFRSLADAEALETFSTQNLATIRSTIERKNWNAIFRLQAGDGVIVFTEPKLQATKKFNDVLFGPLKTDIVNAKRNTLLREKLTEAGGLSGSITLLEQSFKNSFFKVEGALDTPELAAFVNKVCAEVDSEMKTVIDEAIEEELRGLGPENSKDMEKRRALTAFRAQNETGYKIGFGISKVESSDAPERVGVTQAITEAWTGSLMNRAEMKDGAYGTEFSAAALTQLIEENKIARTTITEQLSKRAIPVIHNHEGKAFVVFTEANILHTDLLRELRKGTFTPAAEDTELVGLIEAYRQRLNVIDVVKPYTLDEIAGEANLQVTGEALDTRLTRERAASDRLGKLIALRAKLETGQLGATEQQDLEKLQEEIIQDKDTVVSVIESSKDGIYSSDAIFHYEAVHTPNCAYITLDALDVGVRGAQLTDELMQQVEQGALPVEQALLQAGDTITKELRQFRTKVLEIVAPYYGDKIPTLVGGDEITLAIDTSKISEEKLQEMLLAIRTSKEFSVRLVMAKAEKKSEAIGSDDEKDGSLTKLIEHVGTLRRVEQGVDDAKKIEKALRELQLYANKTTSWGDSERRTCGELVNDLYQEGFVVQEQGKNNFVIKSRGSWSGRTTGDILHIIEELRTI